MSSYSVTHTCPSSSTYSYGFPYGYTLSSSPSSSVTLDWKPSTTIAAPQIETLEKLKQENLELKIELLQLRTKQLQTEIEQLIAENKRLQCTHKRECVADTTKRFVDPSSVTVPTSSSCSSVRQKDDNLPNESHPKEPATSLESCNQPFL